MSAEQIKIGALYIRVSTHGQEELSPDAQKRLLLEYAVKNNILIPESYIYTEDGISGRKADKRPKFQEMIAQAKSAKHPFDVILVWKYSRFARNQEESIVYKSMLHHDCVEVISISEPLIDGPFGSLIERIIEWMDEYYSIRLSGEVFRGMTENAMRGKYQAKPPLGYRIAHHGEPPIVVPEEAAIIHLIFNLYTEQGLSMFEIARYLNANGYRTSKNKPFEKRSIDYILHNPMYIGKTVWNRRRNEDKSYKDPSEWIVTDGFHEPILSPAQFEKAKQRQSSEFQPPKCRPASVCKHWLSGIVKCSACGRTLTCSTHTDSKYKRQYTNFQCYGVLKGQCSVSQQISEKKLVPLILSGLEEVLSAGNVQYQIQTYENSGKISKYEILHTKLEAIKKKEERIRQTYRDGIDTLEEYKNNKEIIQKEQTEIHALLAALKQDCIIPVETSTANLENLKKIKNVYEIIVNEDIEMSDKNKALKSVVEKIVFDRSGQKLDIYFRQTQLH